MRNHIASLFNWTRLIVLITGILMLAVPVLAQHSAPAVDGASVNPWVVYAAIVLAVLALATAIFALFSRRRTAVVVEPEPQRRRRDFVPEPEPRVEPVRPVEVPPVRPVTPPPPPPPPPVPQVEITVTPTTADAGPGQTVALTAGVANAPDDSTVTWCVHPPIIDSGKVDSTGPQTAEYKAPEVVNVPRDVTVRVRPVADRSKVAIATIHLVPPSAPPAPVVPPPAVVEPEPPIVPAPQAPTVEPSTPPVPKVEISQKSVVLNENGVKKFDAVVTGTPDTKVVWSIDSVLGKIDQATGEYTAPPHITLQQEVVVTAALEADPGIQGTAKVILRPASETEATRRTVVRFADFSEEQQDRIAAEVLKAAGVDIFGPADLRSTAKEIMDQEKTVDGRKVVESMTGHDSEAVKLYDQFVEERKIRMQNPDNSGSGKGGILAVIAVLALTFAGHSFAATTCYEAQTHRIWAAAGEMRHFTCSNVLAGVNKIEFTDESGKALSGFKVDNPRSVGYNAEFDLTISKGVEPVWPKMMAYVVDSSGKVINKRDEGHPLRVFTQAQSYTAEGSYDVAKQYVDEKVQDIEKKLQDVKASIPTAPPAPPPAKPGRSRTAAPAPSGPAPAAPTATSARNPRYDAAYRYAVLALRLSGREPLKHYLGAEAGERMYKDLLADRISPEEVFNIIETNRTDRIVASAVDTTSGRIDEAIKSLEAVKVDLATKTSAPPVSDQHIRDLARNEVEGVIGPVRTVAERADATAANVGALAQRADTNAGLALTVLQAKFDKKTAKRTGNPLVDKKVRNATLEQALANLRALQQPAGEQSAPPPPPAKDRK